MRHGFSSVVGAGLILLADSTHGQVPVPIGAEFLVNVITAGNQNYSDIALDADGDFVVVWRSSDGLSFGIFARRFGSSGVAQGGQFQVNSYTTNEQSMATVDMEADGDFVVTWESDAQDGNVFGVFARRFSSAGVPLTAELAVNTYTSSDQRFPSVAAESDGDFVVAWHSSFQDGNSQGVFARRFNSAGSAQGGEFSVNSYTVAGQIRPDVDRAGNGDFVITWMSGVQDGADFGIFGQRFSSAGAKLGPEFQVNTTFTGAQVDPSVGVDSDGDFVVVWQGYDGGYLGIFGQRFDASGAPQGGEFLVSAYFPPSQDLPVIAVDADGDFVVTWVSEGPGSTGDGIFARRFKSSGAPQTSDLKVNTTISDDMVGVTTSVGASATGDFVVSWTNRLGVYSDTLAQRFDVPPTIDVDGDGMFLPLTDGLLVLRFGFGFTGNTLITGAVAGACTRCDAPSITAYLQSLL